MVAELVLERVAATLNLSPLAVREPLLYREGDVTHFGMVSDLITARMDSLTLSVSSGREWACRHGMARLAVTHIHGVNRACHPQATFFGGGGGSAVQGR